MEFTIQEDMSKITDLMVRSNGEIQENRITILRKLLDEDDAKSLQKLLEKATDIILEESENHEFTILQVEISLSLFKKPYIHIWLKEYTPEMNKCYKTMDIFGHKVNPSFPMNSGYEPFILDFKPF